MSRAAKDAEGDDASAGELAEGVLDYLISVHRRASSHPFLAAGFGPHDVAGRVRKPRSSSNPNGGWWTSRFPTTFGPSVTVRGDVSMPAWTISVRHRLDAVIDVMRQRDLRRLQLGWTAFFVVDAMSMVALSVWAFDDGGASAVGILGLARLLPGAIALPFGAWAADRFSRRRVVTAVFAAIAVTQALIAIALVAGVPAVAVYVLVAVGSIAATPYRSAQLALAPLVAATPGELVAMNVTAGTLEGLATFAGPALAALLLLTTDSWFVVGTAAAAAGAGFVAVSGIRVDVDPSKAVRRRRDRPLEAVLGGLIELRNNTDAAVVVGCFVAQVMVRGFLTVLLVSVSFDLLKLDNSGIGWLAAAMGIGGIAGGVYAVGLTERRRLGRPFAFALALWGLPIALIGLVPRTAVVIVALLAIGVGNALLDVSGFTLIQRLGADRSLWCVVHVRYRNGRYRSIRGAEPGVETRTPARPGPRRRHPARARPGAVESIPEDRRAFGTGAGIVVGVLQHLGVRPTATNNDREDLCPVFHRRPLSGYRHHQRGRPWRSVLCNRSGAGGSAPRHRRAVHVRSRRSLR